MGEAQIPPNPTNWIPQNSWPGMYRQFKGMESLDNLKGLEAHFLKSPGDFKGIYDSSDAHEEPMPSPWNTKLGEFEKMIVLKALRPDKLVPAI